MDKMSQMGTSLGLYERQCADCTWCHFGAVGAGYCWVEKKEVQTKQPLCQPNKFVPRGKR